MRRAVRSVIGPAFVATSVCAVSASSVLAEARDPIGEFLKRPPAKSVNKQDKLGAPPAEKVPVPTAKPTTIKPAVVEAPAPTNLEPGSITIVVTGDTGFSRNHSPVHPKGVLKFGRRQPWSEAMSGIAKEINGDLNFTNIETVVTNHNKLSRDLKGQKGPFNFRSHPNGIRHLVKRGFNLMSLANNHSMDYKVAGLNETLRHIRPLKNEGLKAYAGIGANREEASRPQLIKMKGSTVAFSAIGIVTNNLSRHRAGKNKPGQIAYRFDDDYRLSVDRLAKTKSDYQILSIHYGVEGRVRTDARQIKQWRGLAARKKKIDLVIGHHAHVPRAVERVGNSVIFYGLGNFLHHGTANMGKKGICRDFGVVGRVHLRKGNNGKLFTRAVEVIPVTKMHIRPERLPARASADRVHALNYLAGKLPSGGEGMRFQIQKNGNGLYCFKGASKDPGRVGKLCSGYRGAGAIPSSLTRKIANSCAR